MDRRYLYLDADRFFAHVELWLRGLDPATPLLVAAADGWPVLGGHGVIAASTAARRAGVERGMRVREARAVHPPVRCVPQRPDAYVRAHRRMVRAVDTVLPVDRVCSIDEVVCRLTPGDLPDALMGAVRAALLDAFGPTVTASLGVAPTPLLAKMAAESRKPGGATHWPAEALPGPLLALDPSAVPGLGPARRARLAAAGADTMAALWALAPRRWRDVLGTVEGERIALALHGVDVAFPRGARRSLSCSRVLVPGEHDPGVVYGLARALVMVLLSRARREGLVVDALYVSCGDLRIALPVGRRMAYRPVLCRLARCWPARLAPGPSVVATAELEGASPGPALAFLEGADTEAALSDVLDAVQARFGTAALDFGRVLRRRWMGRKIAFESVPH